MAYQLIDTATNRVLGSYETEELAAAALGRQMPEMNKYEIKVAPEPVAEEAPAEEAPAEEAPAEEAVVAEVADGEAESE